MGRSILCSGQIGEVNHKVQRDSQKWKNTKLSH